ncbi:MAG: DpnI domain-containing protein [Sedimentisphaerales bacterium]|nr:DpnI domain-containing protein [Sedimentisphaerales bacterium]
MNLNLPVEAAEGYRSASQKARVMTEAWTSSNMYCPACVCNCLSRTKNNTEVVDFFCDRCDSQFQLKATSKLIGRKIVDAAYDGMMRAIMENRLPHLLMLSYDNFKATVNDLLFIPGFCFSASAIEARKPLKPTARRAGWVGCNIVLDLVPPEGRIKIVQSGNIIPKVSVRKNFRNVEPLADFSSKKRGWTLDVLTVLRSLSKREFTIAEAYSFEKILSQRHPENRHVRAKIRQQLQILRDLGYLKFIRPGHYCWKKS